MFINKIARYLLTGIVVLSVSLSYCAAEEEKIEPQNQPQVTQEQAPAEEAPEPRSEKKRLTLIPMAKMYMPASSNLQQQFGDSWAGIGIGLGYTDRTGIREGLSFYGDGIRRKAGANKVLIAPIGVCYTTHLSKSATLSPYAGGGVNLNFIDLHLPNQGIDTGLTTKFGTSIYAGAYLGSRVNVEAAYYWVPKVEGVDLSGLSLTLKVQL